MQRNLRRASSIQCAKQPLDFETLSEGYLSKVCLNNSQQKGQSVLVCCPNKSLTIPEGLGEGELVFVIDFSSAQIGKTAC